jgi:hypothetical protein
MEGKVMISLSSEHAKLLPKRLKIKKVMVKRPLVARYEGKQAKQYEIIATNYNPEKIKPFKGRTPRISQKMPRLK